MSIYRVTVVWNQFVMGVSETMYTRDVDIADFPVYLGKMLTNRAALLWTNQEFVGVRIAQVGPGRKSTFLPPGPRLIPGTATPVTIPARGVQTGAGQTTRPDQLRAVLQYTIGYAGDRTAIRYMSGIPDVFSGTENDTMDFPSASGWTAKFTTWANALISDGWQIRARTTFEADPVLPAVGMVLQEAAPGYIGVQVAAGSAPVAIVRGSRISLAGFIHRPHRVPSINGMWTVDSVNNTLAPDTVTYFLRASNGVNISEIKKLGTVRRVAYTLYPIQRINFHRIGIHKRGRPSPAPVGRRKSRPTLDP